jgi:HAMP domain-containing protein
MGGELQMKGGVTDQRHDLDVDNINFQTTTAEDIVKVYKRLQDKIEEKRKEYKRLQEDLDKRQERFMKRRAKLQEILGELERDLNVRLGKESVKKENEVKMKDKQQEISEVIETIPQKIKRMIDVELEEYSKAFNTQVQNMKKEMNSFFTSKKE